MRAARAARRRRQRAASSSLHEASAAPSPARCGRLSPSARAPHSQKLRKPSSEDSALLGGRALKEALDVVFNSRFGRQVDTVLVVYDCS